MGVIADITSVGTLGIASWAAWNAYRARQWQKEADERRRTPSVRLEFNHATLQRPTWADPRPLLQRHLSDPTYGYALDVNVINDGDSPVWLRGLYVEEAASSEVGVSGIDLDYPFRAGDVEIKPHQRHVDRMWVDTEERLDFSRGVVAKALLASGNLVYSETEFLMEDMLADVRAGQP